MATAVITINSVPGSSLDLPINTLVTLDTTTLGSTYLWSILSQPAGTADTITGPTNQTASFTPTKEGSYLIKLVVDAGPTESVGQAVAAVLELQTGNRIPAVGETTEASSTDGWGTYAVDEILQRVTRFTDAGVISGIAGEALTAGMPVYASGVTTIATGLPDERPCMEFKQAFATTAAEVEGNLCVALSNASTGDVVRLLAYGLVQGVPVSGSPAVGDPLYVSDLGTIDLSPGTNPRSVATVVAVGSGTVDIFFGGEQAIPFGTAVGDLTGLYPGPTVASLQGYTLDLSTGPSSGEVLGWDGSAWVPTTNSALPSGTASGDLSGTYPGPTVAKLQGYAVDSTAPTSGKVLGWDGSKWTPTTDLGTAGTAVNIYGKTVDVPVNLTPTALGVITVTASVHTLTPATSVIPSIVVDGVLGQRVTFIGANGNDTTFTRGSSFNMALGAPTRVVHQYDVLELVFDGTYWCEVSFSSNSL